jgi:hypothetical protein
MEIRIEPAKVAATLFAVAIALVVLHFAGQFSRYFLGHGQLLGLVDEFNVNVENNVPTFFSAFLLLACSVTLFVIARAPACGRRESRYWGWLGVIFLFLALDEDASIHELLIRPMDYVLPEHGVLHFAWVLPYGLATLVVGLVYLRFVLGLPDPTRRQVILAGVIYLSGALGFELIGGWYIDRMDGVQDFRYMVLVAAEEFLEMCGAIFFLYVLLALLGRRLGGAPLAIRFGSG